MTTRNTDDDEDDDDDDDDVGGLASGKWLRECKKSPLLSEHQRDDGLALQFDVSSSLLLL